jgi:short-subunit dehydrogenase
MATAEPEGKTVLLTGATDGLGRALATDLAGRGATLLLHGRDEERGAATLAEVADESAGRTRRPTTSTPGRGSGGCRRS